MKYPIEQLIEVIESDLNSIDAGRIYKVPARTIHAYR
jgi:hypothetical protein